MFSKQDIDIMTLNCKTSGLEQKLCNLPFPLAPTNAILSYIYGTPKTTLPASSSSLITLLHWFYFLSHQAQIVYPPFNSLSLLPTRHLPNFCLTPALLPTCIYCSFRLKKTTTKVLLFHLQPLSGNQCAGAPD